MAQLGTDGCGFEQHLESMRRGLENGKGNGFLRDDAFLAVIFIQDEDDCSASDGEIFNPDQDLNDRGSTLGELSSFRCFEFGTTCEPADERTTGPRDNCTPADDSPYIAPVSDYVSYLQGIKEDPTDVIVAAITGPTGPVNVAEDPDKDELWVPPACVVCNDGAANCDAAGRSEANDALVAAAPGIRMNTLLQGFPGRSTVPEHLLVQPEDQRRRPERGARADRGPRQARGRQPVHRGQAGRRQSDRGRQPDRVPRVRRAAISARTTRRSSRSRRARRAARLASI